MSGFSVFRLPFESEWEFAAKGGEAYLYAGSDDLNQVGWYDDNAQNTTHPVGQKLANSYGTYDFCGNIWEWCVDDYDQPNSYNPHATYRAYRGGSWYFNAGNCHISFRYFNLPNQSSFDLGMRIAQSTNP